MNGCKYNPAGVLCETHNCDGCGWTPEEAERRRTLLAEEAPHPNRKTPYSLRTGRGEQ